MRREIPLAIAYLLLLAFLGIAAPTFYSASNLRDLLLSNIPVLVIAAGMTLVILTGHIDISVGSQFAICGVAAGTLAKSGAPMPVLAVLTGLIGAGLGSMNGALVALLGIPSIVVTLATMVILRDALRWATQGRWIQDLPAGFQWLGLGQSLGQWSILAIAASIALCFGWGLRNLAAGRALYATGSDEESARLAGMPTRRLLFGVFAVTGALTGIAALLNSIRFAEIQSSAGVGLEMKTIAAVVVGGASINGGRGTMAGTLLGVALLATIGPALTFLGINAFWEKAIQGAIILIAVALDLLAVRSGRHAEHLR